MTTISLSYFVGSCGGVINANTRPRSRVERARGGEIVVTIETNDFDLSIECERDEDAEHLAMHLRRAAEGIGKFITESAVRP